MMNMSRRARRMERHHKRRRMQGLNLVSLMDIFTILVFFLLVSSSDSGGIPSAKVLKLPESIAKEKPKETLSIIVTSKDIIVQGRKVETIADIIDLPSDTIPGLKKELDYHANRTLTAADAKKGGGEITILGDRVIPYKLLKKIMVTCTKAKFTNISLAVVQKSAKEG
ncbi:MAG: ExbD/TolR family protein [Gammaproteobacteria bacterium]